MLFPVDEKSQGNTKAVYSLKNRRVEAGGDSSLLQVTKVGAVKGHYRVAGFS